MTLKIYSLDPRCPERQEAREDSSLGNLLLSHFFVFLLFLFFVVVVVVALLCFEDSVSLGNLLLWNSLPEQAGLKF